MGGVRRIVYESYPVLMVALLIALAGGSMLGSGIDEIAEFPLILAMIPVINGTAGNLGSILGSRLTSALHLGTLKPRLRRERVLRDNLAVSLFLSLSVFSMFGAVFFSTGLIFGLPLGNSLAMAAAFFVSGVLLSVIVMITTVASAFVSFKGGLDPDNVVIPIMTSISDVMGIMVLLLMVKVMVV